MAKPVKAFSIEEKVMEKIVKEAKRQNRSISNLVNMILTDFVQHCIPEEPKETIGTIVVDSPQRIRVKKAS